MFAVKGTPWPLLLLTEGALHLLTSWVSYRRLALLLIKTGIRVHQDWHSCSSRQAPVHLKPGRCVSLMLQRYYNRHPCLMHNMLNRIQQCHKIITGGHRCKSSAGLPNLFFVCSAWLFPVDILLYLFNEQACRLYLRDNVFLGGVISAVIVGLFAQSLQAGIVLAFVNGEDSRRDVMLAE